ncbi:MAG: S-methyl-5-thioribose-1-phosphate isomerase [bacterium]|nr:S-methyl-5-thioribose-1-phosphate isomerase [bacterium]
MLPKTIEIKNDRVFLIDQTKIPYKLTTVEIKDIEEMFSAIKNMIVRGAPAIGVAAAAGIALYIKNHNSNQLTLNNIVNAGQKLKNARPTAVNLSWGIDNTVKFAGQFTDIKLLQKEIWTFVKKLADEDITTNRSIGKNGAEIIKKKDKINVLTHCNAGSLATVYWGTALGVIRELASENRINMVYADETRPRLQGGKITAFELQKDNIPVTVLTDSMAAHFMKKGVIDIVITGADRIALNGDTANKIGTYSLAICADYHNIPFYVAAPVSTIDFNASTGNDIPVEERGPEEVTHINSINIIADNVKVLNPAFDITPARLIKAIITEKKAISGDLEKEILLLKKI